MCGRCLKIALFWALFACAAPAGEATQDETTVEWVCAHHLDRVEKLFDALKLGYPGLEEVKTAVEKQDWPAASLNSCV